MVDRENLFQNIRVLIKIMLIYTVFITLMHAGILVINIVLCVNYAN